MSYAEEIQAIYDEWDRRVRQQAEQRGIKRGLKRGLQRGREEGREQGLRRALVTSYQARFGTMPEPLHAAIEATEDEDTLLGWVPLFTTGSVEDIAAAVLGANAAEREPAK